MDEHDRAVLDQVTRIFSGGAQRIAATALVRHDPLTGRAYVHIDPVMASGLQSQGYDLATYARDYEASLRRSGHWPADPPIVLRRRVKRWSRRTWRLVIGHRH